MDPEHRKLISSNLSEISNLIDIDLLKTLLLENQIFTRPMIEDIYEIKKDIERKHSLLTELQTRGPFAFEKFIRLLEISGHNHAAALLKSGTKMSCPNELFVQESESVSLPVVYENETSITEGRELRVIPAKEWRVGPNLYTMTSTPRGCCLIINNVDFEGIKEERVGSDVDAIILDKAFQGLGYDVYMKNNLTREEMLKKLNLFSKVFATHEVDSCVVIILSHGDQGGVYGVDSEFIVFKEILEMFDNNNCPYLKTKPKMFFFQSCQGRDMDNGVQLFESTDAVQNYTLTFKSNSSVRLPSLCDFLISHSTVQGCVSMRTELGSWYCQMLARALAEHACEMDLESILKLVDAQIRKKISTTGLKQATEYTCKGWCKKLYFNPGLEIQ